MLALTEDLLSVGIRPAAPRTRSPVVNPLPGGAQAGIDHIDEHQRVVAGGVDIDVVRRALMVVDVVFPGWIPFKGLAVSQDIPGWVRAQNVAMGYAWQTLVAGHLGRLGTRADVELQQHYVA